jgi:hypothetical protein
MVRVGSLATYLRLPKGSSMLPSYHRVAVAAVQDVADADRPVGRFHLAQQFVRGDGSAVEVRVLA